MSDWHCFHPSASLQHALLSTSDGQIYALRPVQPGQNVADFLRRWKPELAAHTYSSPDIPITAQLLTALALSQSNGQTDFYHYIRHHRLGLFDKISRHFFEGDARDVYALHGLFAIPLAMARALRNDPALTAAELRKPAESFALVVHWIALFVVKFYEEHGQLPQPLDIALHLHGSNLAYDRSSPFRIPCRGNFIMNFLGCFNTAAILINQQEQNHVPQSARPTDSGSPSSPAGDAYSGA